MSGFPKLTPAFTVQVMIEPPRPVGSLSRGPKLVHVPLVPNSGSIRSEPGYPVKLDAVFAHGADFIHVDPSGKTARLEVHSLIKDTPTGATARFNYTGIIDLTGPAGKVLGGASDAKTTPFGDAFAHMTFETGSAELKALEDRVYVAAGRFVLEDGKPTIVEYKLSEVTA